MGLRLNQCVLSYFKTLRRIKADYARFDLDTVRTAPEAIVQSKIKARAREKTHSLRPVIRYSACAAVAVAIVLAGAFAALFRGGNPISPAVSSGKTAVSHDFELTAYAVNSTTHKKTAIDFNTNMHIPRLGNTNDFFEWDPRNKIYGWFGFSFVVNGPNAKGNGMIKSITYQSKNSSFIYKPDFFQTRGSVIRDAKSVTITPKSKAGNIFWNLSDKDMKSLQRIQRQLIKPCFSSFEGDVITVTAKFKDGATAKKRLTVKFTTKGRDDYLIMKEEKLS